MPIILELTPDQKDILTEIVNIGFGRAAASLSALVGQRVILELPSVRLHTTRTLHSELDALANGKVTVVRQAFMGDLRGDALLFMDFASATVLIDLLSGGSGVARRLMPSDREALLEIGNILLNAYLGSFANLLKLPLRFSLPELMLETVRNSLANYEVGESAAEYSLLVKTEFHFKTNQVVGYVALVIANNCLARFLSSLHSAEVIE